MFEDLIQKIDKYVVDILIMVTEIELKIRIGRAADQLIKSLKGPGWRALVKKRANEIIALAETESDDDPGKMKLRRG